VGKEIAISATSLAPGDYTKNISIGGYSSNEVTAHNPKDIQALIHVNECTASVPSCFFTDSAGEFLSNCSGDLVSTNDGGVFQLVNKKTGQITATNPGQFYYNYIWTNDGPAIDVQINFGNPQNLVPQGANAVHAYTFDTSGFTQNVDAFNMVNANGTPCGPAGPCTINVGQGETLWVTWHLAYSRIGQSAPTAGNTCEVANEEIGASAMLLNANDSQIIVAGECSTSANGYNKK
jgi:hypothetical protein